MKKLSKGQVVAYVATLFAMFPAFAHAALAEAVETALTTAFAALIVDATELQALVMVPIIGILSVSLVVKLVKRFGNKI